MDELKRALEWHQHATPNPTNRNKCIALGVHFEEITEMFEALDMDAEANFMRFVANSFKSCDVVAMDKALKADRLSLLDSILDQNVTSCGISNAYGFNHLDGLAEVNDSNFSKFENCKPVFNEQGKIAKGRDYVAPDLKEFI